MGPRKWRKKRAINSHETKLVPYMTRNNGRFCERDKKEEQLFSLCELEVIRWWQRRTTIFLSARLIEVARLASTLVEVNICKICKIQKTTNFTHFISKIFHTSPSKNVHIYTFIIVTTHICTVTVACVYRYFINFTFCAFFSLPFPHRLFPQIHTNTNTNINT